MCYECGCYGAVTPYGVGGREMNQSPKEAKGGVPPEFDRSKAGEENYEKKMKYGK